ncbi:MAG: hypothetical protein AAF649_04830 [Verrucomicrobiota bacterium]
MKACFFCLFVGLVTFTLLAHAGDDVDASGPQPVPPADTAAPDVFSKADCDKKIADLTKQHNQTLKKLRNQLKNQKEKFQALKTENDTLMLKLAEPPEPVAETTGTHWFPWILAFILAVVGFLIGRSTSGRDSSSNKS